MEKRKRKRLTKKQALQECYVLWNELAETGERDKKLTKWFNNTKYKWILDCPCCEYIRIHATTCSGCPLMGYWDRYERRGMTKCVSYNGLFRCWDYATTRERRKKWARKIADAALAELKRMEDDHGKN